MEKEEKNQMGKFNRIGAPRNSSNKIKCNVKH